MIIKRAEKWKKCPLCRLVTLKWNEATNLYECSNVECNFRLPLFLKKGLEWVNTGILGY
jgi:hypothetical protein